MKKVRSTLLMISLMFFLTLTATGCTQTGSDTMSKSGMDKAMDTMNTETMDGNMDKNMQNGMK